MNKKEIIELLEPKCNGYDLPHSLNIELIAELLVDKQKEAINYTRSCCKLKDKETITFEEYLKEQGWEIISDSFIYKQGNNYKDMEEIRKEYFKKIYNL
jgi:hypothetical protein